MTWMTGHNLRCFVCDQQLFCSFCDFCSSVFVFLCPMLSLGYIQTFFFFLPKCLLALSSVSSVSFAPLFILHLFLILISLSSFLLPSSPSLLIVLAFIPSSHCRLGVLPGLSLCGSQCFALYSLLPQPFALMVCKKLASFLVTVFSTILVTHPL